MTPRRGATQAQRAEAVALAAKIGAAATGRQLGIPAANVRKWCQRAGDEAASAVATVSPHLRTSTPGNRWAERRPVVVDALAAVAEEAAGAALRSIRDGKAREAKDYVTAAAIAVDKVQLLTGAVTARTQTEVRGVTLTVHRSGPELIAEMQRVRAELDLEPSPIAAIEVAGHAD